MLVAAYLILQKNNQVLLLRRFNTNYEDGNYSLIAGHVESDEQITQSLIREAKEEANLIIKIEDLIFEHVIQRKCVDQSIYLDFFFTCQNWEGEVKNLEPHKCDDLSWFALDKLPQNIIPHVREVLELLNVERCNFSEAGW